MEITINFVDGVWKTEPNPAIIVAGTTVRWIVKASKSEFERLRWSIDFPQRSPFNNDSRTFEIVTHNTGLGSGRAEPSRDFMRKLEQLGMIEEVIVDHRGTVTGGEADAAGQYKYDLRLKDENSNQTIGEEDPIIVVVRPITVWL